MVSTNRPMVSTNRPYALLQNYRRWSNVLYLPPLKAAIFLYLLIST